METETRNFRGGRRGGHREWLREVLSEEGTVNSGAAKKPWEIGQRELFDVIIRHAVPVRIQWLECYAPTIGSAGSEVT